MFNRFMGAAACVAMFAWTAAAQDLATVVANASKAMGADNLKSVTFAGKGWEYSYGQAPNPSSPWPGFEETYTRTINFETPAWKVDRVLDPVPPTRRGGGLPPGPTQTVFLNANTNWATQADHWTLPYAFLKAAVTYNATVTSQKMGGKNYTVVTFTAPSKAKVIGYINDQNMLERVDTWIDNAVTGDTPFNSMYTEYKDFGGLKFPTRIARKQGDWPIFDLTVTDVKPNAPADFPRPPAAGGGGGGRGPAMTSRQLSDGVYLILGGYASIAVDFKDYIVILESGNSDANATGIITEAKRLIPNKPIKYLFNTHGHFDHSSGVRRFMAEGATIITWEPNKKMFEKVATMPHTLNPDTLSRSPKTPVFETIKSDKKVLTDGNRVVELYRLKDSTHNDGLYMAYLPKEKILLEADAWNPPEEADGPPAANNNAIFNKNLAENLQRLKLNIDTIVSVHYPVNGRPIAMAEFNRAAAKLGDPKLSASIK